jgi:uncharacterized protein
MQFEWDGRKASSNLKKHKISFEEAVTVFYDPLAATFSDPDHSDDEERFITIGYTSRHRLLVVSYTERKDSIRIFSARRANEKERRRHET